MACYLHVVESEDRKNKSRDAEAPDTNCPGRILGNAKPSGKWEGRADPYPRKTGDAGEPPMLQKKDQR